MAQGKRETNGGMLGRLAERGEDAVTRLMDELGRNPRVTDALGRAMAGKGKVDEATRKTLGRVGLAASDEIKDLRKRVNKLEQRLAKLEAGGSRARSQSDKTRRTTAKSSSATRAKARSSTRSRSGGSSTG